MADGLNIAMWSGPRNLSTALMRSFGNRSDVISVLDEPLYAAYLSVTGKNHPMRNEIIASQSSDPDIVAKNCTKPIGKGICYQKHMVHHLHHTFDDQWIFKLHNCFLIRNPEDVISSFLNKWPDAEFEDFGFDHQFNIFNLVSNWAEEIPLVIDATDLRNNPKAVLKKVCLKLLIPWDDAMLEWKAGLKKYDGVWATHWYPSVESSTGFVQHDKSKSLIHDKSKSMVERAMPSYHALHKHRI